MTTQFEDRTHIFCANPYYKEIPRYDWAYVEYTSSKDPRTGLTEKTRLYPALVLGFVCLPGDVQVSAVIRNSTNPVSWEQRMRDFVSHFELGSRIEWDYDIVPVSLIVHPLFVLQDYSNNENKFFCVLPKKTWPDYFSNSINKINPICTDKGDVDSNSKNSVLLETNNINNSASDSSDLESDVIEEADDESDIDRSALPITDDNESNWSNAKNHDSVNLNNELCKEYNFLKQVSWVQCGFHCENRDSQHGTAGCSVD